MVKHLGEKASLLTNLEGIGFVPWETLSDTEATFGDEAITVDALLSELRRIGLPHITFWPLRPIESFDDNLEELIDEGWHLGRFTRLFIWDSREDCPSTIWAFEQLSAATRFQLMAS